MLVLRRLQEFAREELMNTVGSLPSELRPMTLCKMEDLLVKISVTESKDAERQKRFHDGGRGAGVLLPWWRNLPPLPACRVPGCFRVATVMQVPKRQDHFTKPLEASCSLNVWCWSVSSPSQSPSLNFYIQSKSPSGECSYSVPPLHSLTLYSPNTHLMFVDFSSPLSNISPLLPHSNLAELAGPSSVSGLAASWQIVAACNAGPPPVWPYDHQYSISAGLGFLTPPVLCKWHHLCR